MKRKSYISCIVLTFISSSCSFFSAGSYPYAEYYEFDVSRTELINTTKKFKEDHQGYKVMTTFEDGNRGELPDSLRNGFYRFYFNLGSDSTIFCIINMTDFTKERPVRIGLVRLSTSRNFASWKTVNTNEFSRQENKKIKRIFETEILDSLGTWRKERIFPFFH